jgi:hypothetical protein
MDPTVTAAAIGVGGTVIVGLAGFSAAIWTTRRTFANARESRFWDKQAAAYEAALTELAARRSRRERVMRITAEITPPPQMMKEYSTARDTLAWFSVEGQLLAYASKEVRAALDKAREADRTASETFDRVQDVIDQAGSLSETDSKAVSAALLKSQTDDLQLVNLIRAELQGTRGRRTPDRVDTSSPGPCAGLGSRSATCPSRTAACTTPTGSPRRRCSTAPGDPRLRPEELAVISSALSKMFKAA